MRISTQRSTSLKTSCVDLLGSPYLTINQLHAVNMKLKAKKCCLLPILDTLFQTDSAKIAENRDRPEQANVTELRSFVGLCRYYRRFIKKFSAIANFLHALTSTEKGTQFVSTSQCRVSSRPIFLYFSDIFRKWLYFPYLTKMSDISYILMKTSKIILIEQFDPWIMLKL